MAAFFDPAQFKPLMVLHQNWRLIREECAALDRNDIASFERGALSHAAITKKLVENGRMQWIKAWGEHKDRWLNYGFALYDQYPFGDAGAPKTVALLKHIRGLKVAALALFKPGVLLPIHRHPELKAENLLTFHLGLEMAPDHCYLNVEGKFAREEEGKAIVFDGGLPHYAFNASGAERLILYCEFSPERLRWVDDVGAKANA
jgi:beta-hydroxylase